MNPFPTRTRRNFLRTTALATGATALSQASVGGANEKIRIAIVGVGWKGGGHVKVFGGMDDVTLVALCDPDAGRMREGAAQLATLQKPKADLEKDFRKILERKDIDAVVLATPNHWHALQTIWACQAGKDVYVEKPHAHTIWEGRQMIEAANKYGRIVQVGLQARSDAGMESAARWLEEGHLGAIKSIKAFWFRSREGIGKRRTPLKPPASVDYDLWLGPAKDEPLYRDKLHYDWHWDWNTGNGEMGNIGTHVADVARCFLGDPAPAGSVMSFGNRFAWDDAGTTPNVHCAHFDFKVPLTLELNDLVLSPREKRTMAYHRLGTGVVVHCEGGEFRGFGSGKVYDPDGKTIRSFKGSNKVLEHARNFLDAVRSRKTAELHCPIESGHASCTLPLLGGVAWRAGSPMSPRELEEHIAGNQILEETFQRYSEQLKNWAIDFKETPWIVSPQLSYDPGRETFTGAGAEKAIPFLRRPSYREPFVVPEKV
jgi:predicted dehydrogenase